MILKTTSFSVQKVAIEEFLAEVKGMLTKKEVVCFFCFFSGRYVGNGDVVSLKGKLFFHPATGCIYRVHEQNHEQ